MTNENDDVAWNLKLATFSWEHSITIKEIKNHSWEVGRQLLVLVIHNWKVEGEVVNTEEQTVNLDLEKNPDEPLSLDTERI